MSERSLSELFSRDPKLLTDAEVDRIVAALRADRAKWEVEEKKTPAQRAAKVLATPTLSLNDLGLSGAISLPGVKK